MIGRRLAVTATLALWLALLGPASALLASDELLEPEQAFRFSARMSGRDAIEVTYRIADGYYLYKERLHFSAEPAGVRLGTPEFPPAQWHEDEFFGRSEIYRGRVTVRIPVAADRALRTLRIVAVAQGCADVGVCYLPDTRTADLVRLGAGAAGTASE